MPNAACKICIGAATYRRPGMLRALLESYLRMTIPEDAEAVFLVIDNDALGPARGIFEEFEKRLPPGRGGAYVVECAPGIPLARNRALSEALAMGADFLTFVDDDETVDVHWLAALFGAARARGLELVGGPVQPVLPHEAVGFWRRAMFRGLKARRDRLARRAGRRMEQGREAEIAVVTNNWLIDLAWVRRTGLRFDERLRYSGGSDTVFFRDAHQAGIKSGWCPRAVVYEMIPPERLSYGYQYGRARDQAMNAHYRRFPTFAARHLIPSTASAGLKILGGLWTLFLGPFTRGRTLLSSARGMGWGVGRMRAMCGARSELYKSVREP
jgi:succinoglycan biosynthesis protein ExoM